MKRQKVVSLESIVRALLLEKYIPAVRHIEFQVFTDKHGGGVHLMDRDCSLQRSNQKVFEESPTRTQRDKIEQHRYVRITQVCPNLLCTLKPID